MNCQKGDVAIIARAELRNSPNLGVIVKCLEYEGLVLWMSKSGPHLLPTWRVDVKLYRECGDAFYQWLVSDRSLRPIRDPGDDATDEMVILLGKPEGVPA